MKNTPNLREFFDSDLKLINAILALDEFVKNIDEEYPSYHLINLLTSNLKIAHDNLAEHFTYEFEALFPPRENFQLFEVITGGKNDDSFL